MRVICTGNTKRLVKGAVYEVCKLENLDTSNGRYFRPSIIIKLNDNLTERFNTRNFKLENGDPLPLRNWESVDWRSETTDYQNSRITTNNLKKGDYVVYKRNNHKSLILGKKYKVEDIRIFEHKPGWAGATTWKELEIKIEGLSRYYKSYSFRKCTPQETRDISLNVLFDEETGVEKIEKGTRKIDKYDDETKETLLTKILLSAALDNKRNNMTIVDWAISKTAPQFSLQESDFETIINKSLKTILDKWNN